MERSCYCGKRSLSGQILGNDFLSEISLIDKTGQSTDGLGLPVMILPNVDLGPRSAVAQCLSGSLFDYFSQLERGISKQFMIFTIGR